MPRITFTDHTGVAREVDAQTGETLMEAADVFFDTSPHFIARPKR